ncbi:MAG: DoxX family protein [Acidimicrobiia bacterium]
MKGHHVVAGVAKTLGGPGLILPGLTGIRPELTVFAALGLVVAIDGAVIWHSGRGEPISIATNVFNAAVIG